MSWKEALTNRSKQKGTAWETAIVNTLTRLGLHARRVVLHGKEDQGDIHLGGIVIEAKNEKSYKLAEWVEEAKVEAINTGEGHLGIVWAHRTGKADPLDGYVIMDGRTFLRLLAVPA